MRAAGFGAMGGHPMMPPVDPRGIRQYVDLDAPSEETPIDYRTSIDYSDL